MIFLVKKTHESFAEARKDILKSTEITKSPRSCQSGVALCHFPLDEIAEKKGFWQVSFLVTLHSVFSIS